MRELKTEIEIDASPQEIWNILSDFGSYPEWNPFVKSIKGKMAEGEQLEVFLKPPNGKGMSLKPIVQVAHREREFRWLGHFGRVKFLFNGEHYFKIEILPGGGTKFVHGENFTGILVPMLWKSLNSDTKAGFIELNKALKERSEKYSI